ADALFYPIVVMIFATGLLVGLVFVVLPQFDQIFHDFQMRLPAVTEFVLTVGRHPAPILFPTAVAVAWVMLMWLVLRLTARGRRMWAWMLYTVPVAGTLIRAARLSCFADLLAVLIEYELPLPEAFRLAGAASADPLMAHHAEEIHAQLVE